MDVHIRPSKLVCMELAELSKKFPIFNLFSSILFVGSNKSKQVKMIYTGHICPKMKALIVHCSRRQALITSLYAAIDSRQHEKGLLTESENFIDVRLHLWMIAWSCFQHRRLFYPTFYPKLRKRMEDGSGCIMTGIFYVNSDVITMVYLEQDKFHFGRILIYI